MCPRLPDESGGDGDVGEGRIWRWVILFHVHLFLFNLRGHLRVSSQRAVTYIIST